MKLVNCYGTKVPTRRRSTPRWTWLPCILWHCRGREGVDERSTKRDSRLSDVAPWTGIQTGQTRSRTGRVRVLPGTETRYSHYERTRAGVGNAACTSPTLPVDRAADHRARLRPILERRGSGDGSSAFGPVAIPADPRSTFTLTMNVRTGSQHDVLAVQASQLGDPESRLNGEQKQCPV